MIKTNPTYIEADKLNIKEHFKRISNNDQLLYSSVWSWWIKTTLFYGLPLLIGCILLFVAIMYQELTSESNIDWILIISVSSIPIICMLPFIWIGTYYYSFVASKRVTKTIMKFIDTYIPDATHLTRFTQTNYTVQRKGIEFELGYTYIPETSSKGKAMHNHPYFFICLYYVPQPGTELLWFDENTDMRDTYIEAWNHYCYESEICKHLRLDDYAMFALFKKNEYINPNEVTTALDQLEFLLSKFSMKPQSQYLFSIGQIIRAWLKTIDRTVPTDIIALNIGAFETETGYALHISGARHYDVHNDDWACNEDFVPENRYLEIKNTNSSQSDWKEFQRLAIGAISSYINDNADDNTSLFYNKIVTFGFDDGDLIRLK